MWTVDKPTKSIKSPRQRIFNEITSTQIKKLPYLNARRWMDWKKMLVGIGQEESSGAKQKMARRW